MARRYLGAAALSLFSSLAAAEVFDTYTPCAKCPVGIGPPLVEITAQLQELVICTPTLGTTVITPSPTGSPVTTTTTGYGCEVEKSTWVSSSVLAACTDGSYTKTLVTEVDQVITISYSSTTITSTSTTTNWIPATSTADSTASIAVVEEVYVYEVVEYVYTTTFRKLGGHAIPGYGGSGLCPSETCGSDNEGCDFQPVFAKECHNGNCVVYECMWKYIPKRGSSGGSYGWRMEVKAPEFEPLPAWPAAPAGCEVVKAYYYDVVDGRKVYNSACYTVPIVIGFPPQYPPGSCRTCVVPPGWTTIITVLPSPTPTTITLTVPTTVTTTAVTTATGSPGGPLSCPASDRTVFETTEGSTFLVECDVGFSGTEIFARDEEIEARDLDGRDIGTTSTFEACITLCDNTNSCVAVAFYPASGRCRGYSSVTGTGRVTGSWAATLIRKGPGFTTTTSATAGPVPTITPGPTDSTTGPPISTVAPSSSAASGDVSTEASSTETTAPTATAGSNTVDINAFAGPNAQPTDVNGVPAIAMEPPLGGTASITGDSALPEDVEEGSQVTISVDTIVEGVTPNRKRDGLFARQAPTGCTLEIRANGQSIYLSALLTTGGQINTITSQPAEATNPMTIELIQTCSPGSSARLVVFNIALSVTAPPSSTSSAPSSTATPSSTEEPSTTVEPTTTAEPTTTEEPTTTDEPTSTEEPSTTTSTPEPSSDPDADTEESSNIPRAELVPKRAAAPLPVKDGKVVQRRGGRIVGSMKGATHKKAKRDVPIWL